MKRTEPEFDCKMEPIHGGGSIAVKTFKDSEGEVHRIVHDHDRGPGVVYLRDWMKRGGKSYIAVAGRLKIVRDEQLLGFKARGNQHANWAVTVTGESGRTVTVFGCQIRAIEVGEVVDTAETLVVE